MITLCIRSLFVGIFLLAAFLPQVPSLYSVYWVALAVVALSACLWIVLADRQRAVLLTLVLLTMTLLWAIGWGSWQLQNRLDPALEGRDLWVEGRIDGLVTKRQVEAQSQARIREIQRFNFEVVRAEGEAGQPLLNFPSHLRLSVYDGPAVLGGEGWRLRVRLKRPQGFANPGGFDYERWLLARSIGATGYVRWKDTAAQMKGRDAEGAVRIPTLDGGFQRWREGLRQQLIERFGSGRSTAVLLALSIGDLSLLGRDDSLTAQQLGLIHLLTISGLHVGLAAVIGFWLGRVLGSVLSLAFPLRIYGPHCAWLGAVLVAVGYGAVAGYSLATQRSVVVLVVGAFWFCCYRRYSVWLGWWVSMMAVLLLQPLSVLEPGFWFSFVAVAILLVVLARPVSGWLGRVWLLVKLQCVLFVFMGALQVFWGMGVSAISPVVNLLAVPYVSFLVVPPILLALLLSVIAENAGNGVWQLLIGLIDGFWWGLDQFKSIAAQLLYQPLMQVHVGLVLLAGLGLSIAILPVALATRWLGLMAVVAVALPKTADHQQATLTVLDVGQGLAIVAGSQNEWLLYDTGPGFSEDFDTGEAVVLPFLFDHGVRQLELGVISHWDVDHSGGFTSVQRGVKVADWVSGGKPPAWTRHTGVSFTSCVQDSQRQLGAWTVSMIADNSPTSARVSQGNNASCVLLLESQGVRALLPGDIEKQREQYLLQHPWLQQPVDIVVAPHHGSGTSSTPAFVNQLSPRWVVFSSGYRNPYRHPQDQVVARYQQAGAQLLYTSRSGAVTFVLPADAGEDEKKAMRSGANASLPQVFTYRQQVARYWR